MRGRRTAGLDQLGDGPTRARAMMPVTLWHPTHRPEFKPHAKRYRRRQITPEERQKIIAFQERHGIDRVRPVDAKHALLRASKGLKGRNRPSHGRTPSMPKFNLPPMVDE